MKATLPIAAALLLLSLTNSASAAATSGYGAPGVFDFSVIIVVTKLQYFICDPG